MDAVKRLNNEVNIIRGWDRYIPDELSKMTITACSLPNPSPTRDVIPIPISGTIVGKKNSPRTNKTTQLLTLSVARVRKTRLASERQEGKA